MLRFRLSSDGAIDDMTIVESKPISRLLGSKNEATTDRISTPGTHFGLACRHFVAFV